MSKSTSASPLKLITNVIELLMADYTGEMPTIRMIDSAASSAKFPVVRINGRRHVAEATIPQIAALYGLKPKADVSTPRASRKAIVAPVSVAA